MGPPLGELVRTFGRIGLLSFGGPAAQIALMHRVLVTEKCWISADRFAHALSYCMMLPGPEAMQLCTYVGWILHRTRGGVIAGVLFVLPGSLTVLGLSIAYTSLRGVAVVDGIFWGLKPAVVAIVAQAIARLGSRLLRRPWPWVIAVLSLVLTAQGAPFPVVIALAALAGLVFGRSTGTPKTEQSPELAAHTQPSGSRLGRTIAIWGGLWAAPVPALWALTGPASVWTQQALLLSKAAAVTFGGAYAVLGYVGHQAVEVHGWLTQPELVDGLGLAETTPGPLVLVLQFIGYMGAYRNPGGLPPTLAGVLGAGLAVWTTFIPCFLWIFAGAPYMERARRSRALSAALAGVTAAVVGVIGSLGLALASHTLFSHRDPYAIGPLALMIPEPSSVQWGAAGLTALAAVLLLGARWGIGRVILLCVAIGIVAALV